jgi:hypothetical protein
MNECQDTRNEKPTAILVNFVIFVIFIKIEYFPFFPLF